MLSVIIIAKNEAHNLRNCLQSICFADEIIVLDSGSIDNTVEIAKEYTDKVYSTDWQGYGVQKQRALMHATGDWVLNLDADESVDEQLKQEILAAIQQNTADAYRITISMYFYLKSVSHSSSPSRHIRLFKRIGAKYSDDIVHEKIILPSEFVISKLKSPLRHHSYRDLSHALAKINRYSSYSAKIRINKKIKPSLVKTMLSTCWMFCRCYILQRGFMDGKAGFVMSLLSAQGTMYRGLKQLYPDSHLNDLPHVKDMNS